MSRASTCSIRRPTEYNRPFLTPALDLVAGYGRAQGVVFRPGDRRFEGRTARDAIADVRQDPACVMVNRNQGSGTRALIDRLLEGVKPAGYAVQPRNHNAVAAAVSQGRADWGVTLDIIARSAGLGFLPVQEEHYDFVVPKSRANRPGVVAFKTLLQEPRVREALARLGMKDLVREHRGGIILCGGRSTRMGTSKALLPFGAETMLQRVVRLLATVVSPHRGRRRGRASRCPTCRRT